MPDARSRVVLRADAVVCPEVVLRPGWVALLGEEIAAVDSREPRGSVVDLGDRILVPGFVDLHVHGGGGAQVNGRTADVVSASVARLAAEHARHGTTALLATTVSDSRQGLVEAVRGIAACMRSPRADAAVVLGAHLEGPWLAPTRAGAQDRAAIRRPDQAEFDALAELAPGTVRMVTLAPELPGGLDLVRRIVATGAVAALGHTGADSGTVLAAIEAGARHVTHLFDAMPALHHRDPGLVGLALTDERLTVELIPDGVHVDPVVLRLVMVAAAGRVVAVTDAVAAAGMAPGRYRLGGLDVVVDGARARLADDPLTLAGSVLTMDRAVANLVSAGVELGDAVAAAATIPAEVLGDSTRGRIAPGCRADLAVLDPDLTCVATLVGGRIVFNSEIF